MEILRVNIILETEYKQILSSPQIQIDMYNLLFLHHFKWSKAITLPKYFPKLETEQGRF